MTTHQPMPSHLETKRLTLRTWTDSDVDDYHALVSERGDGISTIHNVREHIATQVAAIAQTGIALLAIHRRVEGEFLGYCGLIVGRASLDEPEIAYELLKRSHGRGYATEAARAVLGAATVTGRSRLWATVRTWNAPSFRVLEKLEFQRDHVSEDERGELVWLTRALP